MYKSIIVLAIGLSSIHAVYGQATRDSLHAWYASAWAFNSNPTPLDNSDGPKTGSLQDLRKEAIEFRANYWNTLRHKLLAINPETLEGQERINFEVFNYIVNDKIAEYQFHTYLMPFNAEGGFHTELGFMALYANPTTAEEYLAYLEKLKAIPQYIEQNISLLKDGIAEGYVLPAVIMQDFDQTARAYVTGSVKDNIFYKPFLHIPATIPNGSALQQQGYGAIVDSVFPAFTRLADFLRDVYLPACRDEIGASSLPNGREYYNYCIKYYTTLDMTPEQVYKTGQAEVRRIRAEMQVIIDSLGFDGSFEDFLRFLRTDPQFYAQSPHELLAEASYFSKRIDGKLPEYFGTLPRLTYGVSPVPAEIAPRYTGGRYSEGSYEEHRAGQYWVNTYKLDSRPLYVLPSLTLHEAVPGHHLQISLAAEAGDSGEELPEFRTGYYISAFGEGWGLYSEWLGKEMGIYETLYQQFGALTYEMWRACRLVVDPGMHAMGWSREDAVRFMTENTALSLHEINTEINRYIGWPGQAVSYKTGELTIRALREEAERRLGAKFDIREFHDEILRNGSIPLFVLERVIHAWIDSKSSE